MTCGNCFRITERGKDLHKKGDDRIDAEIHNQCPEVVNIFKNDTRRIVEVSV
jgi:hypothetical protein